jgi:tripartite-type tricarboxylate transporter receptor subunit TctC
MQLSSSPLVLVVNAEKGAKSIDALRALASSKQGGLNYASPVIGTTSHLGGFLLAQKISAQGTHIAYRGAGPAVAALNAGEVDFALMAAVAVLPFIKNKQLRAIGIAGKAPAPELTDAPSLEAAPLSITLDNWQGVFAPASLPKDAAERLHSLLSETMKLPELGAVLAGDGAIAVASSPKQLAQLVETDRKKYAQIVSAANIKPE